MAIIREKRRHTFTTIDNIAVRDEKLSYKARGILTFMLSMDDGFRFSVNFLANDRSSKPDGKTSVQSSLRELKEAGYLTVLPQKREHGRFSETDWLLHEIPVKQEEKTESQHQKTKAFEGQHAENVDVEPFSPLTENPSTVKPSTEKPMTANPSTENPPQRKTNTKKDTLCISQVHTESVTPSRNNNYASKLNTENPVPEDEYGREDNGLASKVQEILDYFKQEVGYGYLLNSYTLQTIGYELDKGYSVEQCKAVIRKKVIEWGENPRMKQWLRLETIFNRKKFDGYVSQPMQVALNAQQAAMAEAHGGKRVEAGTDWSQHHQAQHGASQSNADWPALTMAQIEQILGNSGGDA